MLDGTTSDTGADVGVTINGAFAATSGNIAHYSSGNTAIDLTVADGFSGTSTITVSGSGADWSLGSSASDRIYFGQSSLSTSVLGDANTGLLSSLDSGGTNDLASGNFTAASDIAELAKSQVTSDRARIGAISSYAVTCSLNAYADAKTSLTTAKSAIEDLDYVAETANNNRLQLLIQMGTTLLASLNVTVHRFLPAPALKRGFFISPRCKIGGLFSLLAPKGRKKVRHRRIKSVNGYIFSTFLFSSSQPIHQIEDITRRIASVAVVFFAGPGLVVEILVVIFLFHQFDYFPAMSSA